MPSPPTPHTTGPRMPIPSLDFPRPAPPKANAMHPKRDGRRSGGGGDAERRLTWGQHEGPRPRADAAEGGEPRGGSQPQPGGGGLAPAMNRSEHWHGLGVFAAASLSASFRAFLAKPLEREQPRWDTNLSALLHSCCAPHH